MRLHALLIPAILAPFVVATAYGEDAKPDRYRLEKTDNGFVRMDTQTGAMSLCEERSAQLVCRMAADERSAFQDEIDRLQTSVNGLNERVARLENSLAARLESSLPSEEDFNKTMGYMERFMRSFMGIVKDMQKDAEDTAPPPAPQKT